MMNTKKVLERCMGKNGQYMGGDCECGECESCIAELERIRQSNKRLFGHKISKKKWLKTN